MSATRRSVLRGLAAAPLATLPALALAQTQVGPKSITAARELEARYIAAARRSLEASRACNAADARVVHHEPPAALFVSAGDPLAQRFTPETYLDGRLWFGSEERIGMLRAWNRGNTRGSVMAAALPRRSEVLAAYDEWQAARQAAKDAAGATAADAEYRAAGVVEKAIRLEILELRSSAPEVLRLKLRVFMDSQAYLDWREGLDAGVAQGIKMENGPWEDAFAASIVRDLATAYMGGAA